MAMNPKHLLCPQWQFLARTKQSLLPTNLLRSPRVDSNRSRGHLAVQPGETNCSIDRHIVEPLINKYDVAAVLQVLIDQHRTVYRSTAEESLVEPARHKDAVPVMAAIWNPDGAAVATSQLVQRDVAAVIRVLCEVEVTLFEECV